MKMALLEHNNGSSLCRTCLKVLSEGNSDGNPKHNIFETPELAKKLIACTAVNVEPSDKYPKHLCDCCYNKVNEFHKFRTMCVDSMEHLRKLSVACEEEEPMFDLASMVKMEIVVGEHEVMFQNDAGNADEGAVTRKRRSGLLIVEKKAQEAAAVSDMDLTAIGEQVKSRAKMKEVKVEVVKQAVEEKEQGKNCNDIKVKLVDTVEGANSELHCDETEESLLVRKDEQPAINNCKNNKRPKTKNLRCDICSTRFGAESSLEAHRRAHDAFVCDICSKVYKSALGLKEHHYTHKDKSELPFQCDHENCSQRFINKQRLKDHLLRHAGTKNFVCSFCGAQKTTLKELKIHMNSHTQEHTYPCQLCSRICSSAGKLAIHVRTVHEGIKNYACSYCDRKFGKWHTRKCHEMTHTGERPHKCWQCGKCFTQRGALKTHLKIHMRDCVPLGMQIGLFGQGNE